MGCTFSQAEMCTKCTSGVVYGQKPGVHPVYMSRKAIPQKKHTMAPPLRWRQNRIKDHRKAAKLTQQDIADALAERGIELDRVSVGRIEKGEQHTGIEVIEAIADILNIDVHSMLNLSPEQAQLFREFSRLDMREQRRVIRIIEASRDD